MKNFEVHAMCDGWIGQAVDLLSAITLRDEILKNDPTEEVKILAEVDESDLT